MLEDFSWRVADECLVLFHKSSSFYIAIIHPRLKKGHYVDVYFNSQLRYEFYESNLEFAKLKAEIKAFEFITKYNLILNKMLF